MTPEQLEFVNSLIGRPWKSGAGGPEAFDCWGLAKVVQKELFGRSLPDIAVDSENVRAVMREVATTSARNSWERVDGPAHGRLVEMASGRHPYHIGVYLDVDGGGVLHCQNPAGVCFDRVATLQVAGWRGLSYNEWIG